MNREVFPAVEPASPVHDRLQQLREAVAADPALAVDAGARVRADLVARLRPGGGADVRRFVWSVQRTAPAEPGGFGARTLFAGPSGPPVTLDFPSDPELAWVSGRGAASLHPEAARVDVLRYIPLRRVTVRLHGVPGLPDRTIAKSQSTDALREAHAVLVAVERAVAAAGGLSFSVPRPLGLDAPRHLLLLEEVPGRPLSRQLDALGADEAMARLGALHAELHGLHVPGLTARTTADWLRAAVRAADQVSLLLPSLAGRVTALAERLGRTAPADTEPAFCQGDFVPSQILCDPTGWSVIDLDDAHLADPYAEVAALTVALARELSVKDEQTAARLREGYLTAYARHRRRPWDEQRWRWHVAVAWLRLAARRVVKGRAVPGETESALDRLDAAAPVQ